MARTKGTRRLPPHAFYATQARSTAQVAAAVPPTQPQFERAFDYKDEPTVLAYLHLAPSIQRDMAATNAYIARYGRSPPPHRSVSSDHTDSDPYVWFWPFRWCRLIQPITLFAYVAREGFADVVAWLFCGGQARVAMVGASTLVHVFPVTLGHAVAGQHAHLVEMLLTSPVFLELLTDATQQSVLNRALCRADSDAMCTLLVAHGAKVDIAAPMDLSWAAVQYQVSIAGPAVERLRRAVCHRAGHELERGLREAVVVDHSVLIAGVASANSEAVATLVTRGFVDLDARSSDGRTALMVGAAKLGRNDGSHTCEWRRQIVRCLLDAGGDTTLRDPLGLTALHVAIAHSSLTCFELLLDHTVATSGREAVHRDVTALAMAFERRDAVGGHSQRMLTALLVRGACSSAYEEMISTGRAGTACGDPTRCLGQMKRKREKGEDDDDDEL